MNSAGLVPEMVTQWLTAVSRILSHPLYHGRAVAVLRSTRHAGRGLLKVGVDGLPSSEVEIRTI